MVRRSLKRNADTGLRRRMPKRQATTNARWMHLGAGETSILYALQAMMGYTAQHYVVYSCLLAVLVAVRNNNNHINMIAVDTVIEALLHGPVVSFDALLAVFRVVDCVLFDIPLDDEGQPLQMSATRHLRIDDLSDPEAIRLTRFSHEQLRALYGYFGFEALLDPGEVTLRIPTGHITRNSPCYYRVHPEEAFLFTLIKVATGLTNQKIVDNYFGGDYARWSKTYPFVLHFIDTGYKHIISYAGLVRCVAKFPCNNADIETYVRKEKAREHPDGEFHLILGLRFLPWDIFGFIDCSIEQIAVPFLGPQEEYEGAARWPKYADAQQAFYTGYCKYHGIIIESVFTPVGLSHIF